MYETTYHRPSSVDEAAALFAKGSEAKYLAGGHTLIPVMKQRLASPSDVIDLGKIKELIGIEATGRRADHQGGDDPLRRAMQSADVQEGDPGARPSRLADRRSGRALSRHHRRLDRQQRSGGGLSGGGAGARRDREDQQALDIGG